MSETISFIYKDVESRVLELEDEVRRLKQLFKPWLPPSSNKEEELSLKEETSEVPEPPPAEVIPAEEQAELDRIEKLLNKAQVARNAHRKKKGEIQKENVDDPISKIDTGETEGKSTSEKGFEAIEKDTHSMTKKIPTQEIIPKKDVSLGSNTKQISKSVISNTRKIPDSFTAGSKGSTDHSERTKQNVSAKNLSSKNERPVSSSGKRKVVPAHISAPFQTNPNLRTSKMQTTYRSATSAKSTFRGRGNESSARGRGVGVGGSSRASQSSTVKTGSAGHRPGKSDGSARSTLQDSKAVCDNSTQNHYLGINERVSHNERVKENKISRCKDDARDKNTNCNKSVGDRVSNDKLHETVIQTKTVIDKNSGVMKKSEEDGMDSEGDSDSLFDLKRDGSTIEIPVKLRKYFSLNTKLRRKYQTRALTRKVDSPSSSQNFSSLLEKVEKFEESNMVQSLAKQAESITNIYKHLRNVLESLHLDHVTADSSASDLLHSKRHLEFLLTDFQETEELFHQTDFRLLRAVPTSHRVARLKTEKISTSSVMWYNKFSGIPGHRTAETVIYNSYKDLEKYRSLVFKSQFISAQLEVMDSSAEFIFPVLKSLDPASSEFLSVLRCGYELLLMTSNSSPVVVKDTIEEEP